jgi:L,D-transpeptidase YbiS
MTESILEIKAIFSGAGWDGLEPVLVVRGDEQTLEMLAGEKSGDRLWPVSTGLSGFGNLENSGCTPTGLHRIAACIGAGVELGTVFRGREPTGEVVATEPESGGDYITTRILWLDGLEAGINQGGSVDSKARYIYIHGTPYIRQLGQAVSAGCVRMADQDVRELFDWVRVGTMVLIVN